MNEYWIQIDKWHNKKPDFVKIYAEDKDKALQKMSDILWFNKNIKCEFFSTDSQYKRSIEDIMNFYIVDQNVAEHHIQKCKYAAMQSAK